MKTKAAVLYSQPGKWEVAEVDLDEPKASEVLVKIMAAGMCHSDDHMATGDLPSMKLPICGGHEGAGIVEAVGSADAVAKAGTVAVVGIGPVTDMNIPVSPFILTMFQKRIQGVLYGSLAPSKDILRLLSMYQAGQLKLKELITRTYTLDQVNEGYEDMHAGKNIRGVITFE